MAFPPFQRIPEKTIINTPIIPIVFSKIFGLISQILIKLIPVLMVDIIWGSKLLQGEEKTS